MLANGVDIDKVRKIVESDSAKDFSINPEDLPIDVDALAAEFIGWAKSVRVRYKYFRYPESMLSGELPWEMSRAGLECLAYFDENDMGNPTNGDVIWLWRASHAMPNDNLSDRMSLAFMLGDGADVGAWTRCIISEIKAEDSD